MQKKIFFLHISSSYAKILGQKLFHTRDFPEVGQKQKTEKTKERKIEERTLVITSCGARKAAWAKMFLFY